MRTHHKMYMHRLGTHAQKNHSKFIGISVVVAKPQSNTEILGMTEPRKKMAHDYV